LRHSRRYVTASTQLRPTSPSPSLSSSISYRPAPHQIFAAHLQLHNVASRTSTWAYRPTASFIPWRTSPMSTYISVPSSHLFHNALYHLRLVHFANFGVRMSYFDFVLDGCSTRSAPLHNILVLYTSVSALRWNVSNKVVAAFLVVPTYFSTLTCASASILKRRCILDVPCGILTQLGMSTVLQYCTGRYIKTAHIVRSFDTTLHPSTISHPYTTVTLSIILFTFRPHRLFRNALSHPASAICPIIHPSVRTYASF
jgi:hypothetical protein